MADTIQRINKLQLLPTKEQKKLLNEMMVLSSCIYNSANYLFRQSIINKEKIKNFYEIENQLKVSEDYKLLGRSYAKPKIKNIL